MKDLNDLQFFVAVVEQNGFTAAARVLDVPKSSVSRHIGRLEERLGVRLLERSTRSLRLTEVGQDYYSRARATLADLDAAERDVADRRTEPCGTVRVSCPPGIARYVLAHLIPAFMTRFPQVHLQILATNRLIDLIEDRVDVAIRARTHLRDEALTVRRLGASRLIFVASPAFLAANPPLQEPGDLSRLPFLSFQEETTRPNWAVTGPAGDRRAIELDPVLWSGEFSVIAEAARAGIGVALLPVEAVAESIRDGQLLPLLPHWRVEDVMVHLVFLTKRGLALATRAFIDHIVEAFPTSLERLSDGLVTQAAGDVPRGLEHRSNQPAF